MPKPPNPASLDGLVDLACRDGVDIRPTLLRVATDLYVQKPFHTDEEQRQYVELALGLIDSTDAATRAAVAASLGRYPAAPAPVLAKLARRPAAATPAVATPVTAPAAAPPRAEAAPVRHDAPAGEHELTETFFAAAPIERRLILANLDIGPIPAARLTVGETALRDLEAAALKRDRGGFARGLTALLDISPALADRITTDPAGEPLVLVARALGMKAATLQRILLCLDPAIGQSVQRVFDLANYFDALPADTALRMVTLWQSGRQKPRTAAKHAPVYYDDERRSPRTTGGTRAPAPRPRDTIETLLRGGKKN